MKTKFLLVFSTVFFIVQLNAQNYIIDSEHSTVQIQVERFGVVDVTGRFKEVTGSINFNPEDLSKTNAQAVIKVDSYDANNKGGEDAVKSFAFLNAEKFPEITFQGIKTIVKDGRNFLHGNLTIHGVTKTIELPYSIKGPLMDLPTQKQSIAFNASIVINRQDYGIAFDRKLANGISLVSNDVKITLLILAIAE